MYIYISYILYIILYNIYLVVMFPAFVTLPEGRFVNHTLLIVMWSSIRNQVFLDWSYPSKHHPSQTWQFCYGYLHPVRWRVGIQIYSQTHPNIWSPPYELQVVLQCCSVKVLIHGIHGSELCKDKHGEFLWLTSFLMNHQTGNVFVDRESCLIMFQQNR